MNPYSENHTMLRRLDKDEKIPYDLLLLADETVAAIEKYIFTSEIYVLEREHRMIALYVLQSLNENEIEIKNIAVAEEYQGQGIGMALLQDAVHRAREKGYKVILIGTADAGVKQLYIYQKAGFEIFDIKKNFIIENYPEPIFENGIQLKHMVMLRKAL